MRNVLILFVAAAHSSLPSLFLSPPEISVTQSTPQTTLYRATPEARTCTAYKIMQSVFYRCRAAGQTLEQIDLAIRNAHPWGEPRAWAYKAWLLAGREFYENHGLPLRPRASIAQSILESET